MRVQYQTGYEYAEKLLKEQSQLDETTFKGLAEKYAKAVYRHPRYVQEFVHGWLQFGKLHFYKPKASTETRIIF